MTINTKGLTLKKLNEILGRKEFNISFKKNKNFVKRLHNVAKG